ncbi:hypothetical protein IU501_07205 [Nocardia otitidiscaviarum]|uniref:hypothetical protein n=1 Tax=Nocardia otitidiscaviarum TaxID=1823 RepID=UPI001896153B|nr:hypothetical protein [Nocardia otitidiscaviarum]MBF6132789.1 hypothetical protein [Nocardia otitidiscaviarum]
MLLFPRYADHVAWDWGGKIHRWIHPTWLGAYVRDAREQTAPWSLIADDLQVPAFVARCWAVEDLLRRPFRRNPTKPTTELVELARKVLPADLIELIGDAIDDATYPATSELDGFIAAVECTTDWAGFFADSTTTELLEPPPSDFAHAWTILRRYTSTLRTEATFAPPRSGIARRETPGRTAVVLDVIYVPDDMPQSDIAEVSAVLGNPWTCAHNGQLAWCPLG